jgi:tRNA-specific 2-thiouridylase
MERIVLGLSGGVDSAVAARILAERGFEVLGLYLDIGTGGEDAARQAARELGIDFAVRDIRSELEAKVCAPFAEGYLRGETPNPCVLCNPSVKFPALLRYADEVGARYVATGHYARCENGRLFMSKSANDQSYMLAMLTKEQLRRCVFPLGDMPKTEVRAMAGEGGLSAAGKADSMEICFVPDGDWAAFIERRGVTPPEGDFVDPEGNVLGRHRGIHRYTIGQRKRLGIALGQRMFVSAIDPERNTVTLSEGGDLYARSAEAESVNWLIERPEGEIECLARVRHSRALAEAKLRAAERGFSLEFEQPVRAPVPGQAAVCYSHDGEVLCGGIIVKKQG